MRYSAECVHPVSKVLMIVATLWWSPSDALYRIVSLLYRIGSYVRYVCVYLYEACT